MMKIDIFGYSDEEICAGTCHEAGEGGQEGPCSACRPAAKRKTAALVQEFAALLDDSEYAGKIVLSFHEADASIRVSHPEIWSLLNAAQLSPVTAVEGKVLFLGGFSPSGLLEELRKRYPAAMAT